MIIFILVILTVYSKFSVSMDYTYMHCNFSKYMFNYFKYSEQYLLSFDNTISETQLSTYGTAIKTHDEIIMVMLGTLREISDHHNAKDLITVNLYLNNVSGSLNMIAKNDNGEFSRSEISKHLLKGYKIMHQSIVQRLEYFIEDKCSNVSFENDFIMYTNFKKPIDYSPDNLRCVLEQLRNKIINDMKIYLTLRDIHSLENNPLLENYNVIMKHLALAYESKQYNRFHPKYYLFYDLMEKRPNNFELDLALGSQAKQRASYNDDGQLSDILDELRFTPILKTSEINYRIKLLDIFRFVKFDFDLINIETFQLLVNTAAARPILSALRSYVVLINVFIHQNKAVQFYLKDKIIKMGEDITALINVFMDLNLFKCNFKKKMRYIFNKTFYFIESLKDLNDLFINQQVRILLNYVDLIMKRKYLCFKLNHFDKTYDVEDSITEVIDSTAKKIYSLTIYIEKLKEYQYCFDIVNNYLTLKNLNILTFRKVLKNTIPYEQLGNYEDIYRPLYFPNDNTNDRKLHNNQVSGDKNYNYEKNNDDNEVIEIKNETCYSPKYLEDYLLFV